MNVRTKRNFAIGAIALAAVVVACSNETTGQAALDAGQQVLAAAVPTPVASAQTPTAKAPKGPAKPLPKGSYQMQVALIPDSSTGAPAARTLVPAGWKSEGAMQWANSPGCSDPAVFAWSATSPDGKSTFELFPNEVWQASNSIQVQCQYGEHQNMQSYLTAYVQNHVQGARDFQYRERPDLLEPQREDIAFKMQLINNGGTGMRFWPDAGELTFTYKDNGTAMKGVVGGTARFYLSQASNPLGGPPMMSISAQTNSTYAASFPTADFDANLVEAMRKSVKLDVKWASSYMDLLLKMGDQNVKAAADRATIIIASGQAMTQATIRANQAAGNAAVAKTYADPPISSGATGGGTDDRSQRERIESIRGVETYDDPVYGGTVQLDNTYDHAWRVNNNDSYILTNDPNFNPGAYNIDANELKVTR